MRIDLLRCRRLLGAASCFVFAVSGCSSDNTGVLVVYEPDSPDSPGPIVDSIPAVGPAVFTGAGFEVVPVMEGLDHPWGLAFLPDGGLLVSERDTGRLWVIRDGERAERPVAGVPDVRPQGQGGLLDVVLHPGFEDNGWVYLTYASWTEAGNGTTAVARGRFEGDALVGTEEIFKAQVADVPIDAHFGSRLVFDRDGFLYVSIGDRRAPERAQDPGNHNGTILRLLDDGSVPDDNPFVGDPDALASVFLYGIRNPQGLALHPATGDVLWSEHGPLGGDEINVAQAGANYGWPAITTGKNYDGTPVSDATEAPGMEQPMIHWEPSIAPSGLAVYSGSAFPEWQGDLFTGALAHRTLARIEMDGLEVKGWQPLLGEGWDRRVRDVRDGPDGFLYILTDEAPGGIYRLQPTSD
jgi:glucose/arabinose dehydrogenase